MRKGFLVNVIVSVEDALALIHDFVENLNEMSVCSLQLLELNAIGALLRAFDLEDAHLTFKVLSGCQGKVAVGVPVLHFVFP